MIKVDFRRDIIYIFIRRDIIILYLKSTEVVFRDRRIYIIGRYYYYRG